MQATVETFVPRAAAKVRRIDLRLWVGLFVVVFAVVGVTAYVKKAEARIPVLVAARTVEPGSVVGPADIRIERVSLPSGVGFLNESRQSAVIGKVATERLWPGKLLARASVADSAKLPAGYVAMSLALKPDSAAGGELRPGDHVAVIASNSPDRPDAATRIILTDVPVLSVRKGEIADGGSVTVTLLIRLEEARDLAAARVAGAIDLVLLSGAKQ